MEVQRGKCNYSMLAGSGRKNIYLVIIIMFIDFLKSAYRQNMEDLIRIIEQGLNVIDLDSRKVEVQLAELGRRKGGREGEAAALRTSPCKDRESSY